MIYRIVDTDNFDGDYPNEWFTADIFNSREAAQRLADTLNDGNEHSSRYYKVVEMPYELQPGFEP